jgi:hypothetical protein
MSSKLAEKSIKWLAGTAVVAVLAFLLRLNRGALTAYIDQAGWIRIVRDREAVTAYLDSLGAVGPLVLMGLIGL